MNISNGWGGMKMKPGYRQTEVGVIPEDWDVVQLGQVTEKVGSGITPTGGSRVYKESGRPFIRSQNVGWGNLDLSNVAFIDDATHATFQGTQIRGGDVFLNITGASIGRSAVADFRIEGGNVNQHVCIIRADQGKLAPEFLCSFLISFHGQRQIDSFQAGGNRQGLNFGQVRSIRIAIPETTDEQHAIAAALSDTDALLKGLDYLVAKKCDLKQAVMQQLLTGDTRLPGFEVDWKTMQVGEIGTTYAGLTGKTKSDFGVGQSRYVTFLNVLENVVIDPSRFEQVHVGPRECQNQIRCGDILFNGTSETPDDLAMAAIMPTDEENVFLNSFCFGFKVHDPSENLSLFLAYYFRGPSGRRIMRSLAQGSTRFNISKNQFLSLTLSLPPYDEQRAIAAILCDIDTEISALEARRKKTQDIKQAMMQELLTGKTRLVKPGVSNA